MRGRKQQQCLIGWLKPAVALRSSSSLLLLVVVVASSHPSASQSPACLAQTLPISKSMCCNEESWCCWGCRGD
jgi:hypothetical protein